MKKKISVLALCIMLAYCLVFTACAGNTPGNVPECEHEYSTEIITEPSCEGIGYGLNTCGKCGDEYYEFYEATGHDWDGGKVVLPACTDTGLKLYTCSRCGLIKSQELPSTGHVHTKWQNMQAGHRLYCQDCNTAIEEGTHEFAEGACIVCDVDYDEFLDKFNGTYGYEYFGTSEKSAGLQGLYGAIDESVRAFHNSGADAKDGEVVRINYTQYGLTQSEAISVWKTYRDDNPLYYWMSNRVGSNSSVIAVLCLDEYADGSVRTRQNRLIYRKIDELLNKTCGETSAYMVAFALHDAIINRVDYSASDENGNVASWAHNICGVLEEKGAVCEGYSRSFQLLLNVCGVENVFVTGNYSNHAWNLVKLDDENWYWYDLTWDDDKSAANGVLYKYFCTADEEFLSSHTPDAYLAEGKSFLYKLPESAVSDFSTAEAAYNSTFTVEGIVYTVVGFGLVSPSEPVTRLKVEYLGRTFTVVS